MISSEELQRKLQLGRAAAKSLSTQIEGTEKKFVLFPPKKQNDFFCLFFFVMLYLSKSHTHPSHSQTSRLLTSSLSLGVPVPRPTQCVRGA
jgi:hypothetical protein